MSTLELEGLRILSRLNGIVFSEYGLNPIQVEWNCFQWIRMVLLRTLMGLLLLLGFYF